MAKMPNITEAELKDPVMLARYLRQLQTVINRLESQIGASAAGPSQAEQTVINNITQKIEQKITGGSGSASLTAIRDALQATGSTPLNVQNLRGILTDPQPAGAETFTEMPSATQLQAMQPDTLFIVEDATTGVNTLYYVGDGNPHTAEELSTVPANMMTTDTAQNVTATKTFDADQIFTEDVLLQGAANEVPMVQLSEADVTAKSVVQIVDGVLNLASNASYDGTNWNRDDVAQEAWRIEIDGPGNFIRIYRATAAANPIAWTTNVTFTAGTALSVSGNTSISGTLGVTGLVTLTRAAAQFLSKPSAATAANTRIIEFQKATADGGATTLIMDYEGDVQLNSLVATGTGSFSGALSALTGVTISGAALQLNHVLELWNTTGQVTTSVTPYNVTATDGWIQYGRSGTGTGTINLPAAPTKGRVIFIYDTANSASVNNITVSGNGNNIDGAASRVFIENGFRVTLRYDGSNWEIWTYTANANIP